MAGAWRGARFRTRSRSFPQTHRGCVRKDTEVIVKSLINRGLPTAPSVFSCVFWVEIVLCCSPTFALIFEALEVAGTSVNLWKEPY